MDQPGQENGVTNTGQHFRKTTGNYPDTEKWAMTVSKATAREITENPPAVDRQRASGEPAFLRAFDRLHLSNLPPLLTILHAIPLARAALLCPKYQPIYSYDPQWWTGHPSEAFKITSVDEHGDPQYSDGALIECQRLMAFLDDTQRAYANVDAFVDVYSSVKDDSDLNEFLGTWSKQAEKVDPLDPLCRVFTSKGIKEHHGESQRSFHALEPRANPEKNQSFIDILDELIWNDENIGETPRPPDYPLDNIWLDEIGDIVTIRLTDPLKQGRLGVSVPATWYPDRYMKSWRDASLEMRKRKQLIRRERAKIERKITGLTRYGAPDQLSTDDIKNTLSLAAEKVPLVARYAGRFQDQYQVEDADGETSNSFTSSIRAKEVAKDLRNVVEAVQREIESYEIQARELQAHLDATFVELSGPDGPPGLGHPHRYTLRGISTKSNTTYVLRPADPSSDVQSTEMGQWEWWCTRSSSEDSKNEEAVVFGPSPRPEPTVSFDPSQNAHGPYSPWHGGKGKASATAKEESTVITYSVERVQEEDVLAAARETKSGLLLVYASDHAITSTGLPLSASLRQFIKADNKTFENELRGASLQPESFDTDTEQEMTQLHFTSSNGALIPPGKDDEDMGNLGTHSGTSSALRDPDGQPSPKRARGSEEPPPLYEVDRPQPEMQERSAGTGILGSVRPNKIGQHAEKMMDRVRDDFDRVENRRPS